MTSADPRQYSSAAEGRKALQKDYNYWTGRITDLVFQSSLAMIAANWALISGLHPARFARSFMIVSTVLAMVSLFVGLWGARRMANLHYKQYLFAEQHRKIWQEQWEQSETIESKWPYTQEIEDSGSQFSAAKFWLLLLSGIAFAVGAITTLL